MRKLFLALCIFFSVAACHKKGNEEKNNLFSFRLFSTNNSSFDFSILKNSKASVIVFLAPDCPLSQNYTLTLNALSDKFQNNRVAFLGIISGKGFKKEEVDSFVNKFKIKFSVLRDEDLNLAAYFKATKTPEAFAVNSEGKILYAGAIDNWAVDLGKHRSVITEHYLEDALKNIVENKEIQIKKTEAVGCFIERKL